MSACLSERSVVYCGPACGSANQGGISRATTFVLIARAQGRAAAYESSDIGAIWPGRWQLWQFFWRIGSMSLWNVTAAAVPDAGACANVTEPAAAAISAANARVPA